MFDLNNKVAIVTGASRGIGKTIATTFANAGAHVVCVARTTDKIEHLSKKINSNGGSASHASCDIGSKENIYDMMQNVILEYGKIDILVNNAGITKDSLLLRMKEEDWDMVMNINLKGAFHCMKTVIKPMMKNRIGRIINITSIVGITGNSGQSNYAASKAGLIGFTKSLAKEVASRGITVNCIAPGWIQTEMTNDLNENIKTEILGKVPIGRLGVAEDIAYAALYLASNEASYITGQTITVDGGRIIN